MCCLAAFSEDRSMIRATYLTLDTVKHTRPYLISNCYSVAHCSQPTKHTFVKLWLVDSRVEKSSRRAILMVLWNSPPGPILSQDGVNSAGSSEQLLFCLRTVNMTSEPVLPRALLCLCARVCVPRDFHCCSFPTEPQPLVMSVTDSAV